MKKNYEAPAIEVTELSVNDVIATSGFDGKDHDLGQLDKF